MKRYVWLLPLCLLSACAASNGLEYEAVSEKNMYRIAKTRKGMTESQVLKIMHKPYCYETFQIEDDVYDVWFYVTRTTGLDQTRMVPQNLTPLTFKNGILVGSGYSWYYFAMKEQAADEAAKNPPPPKPPTQQEEDKEFEKLLREPPAKTTSMLHPGLCNQMLIVGLNWVPSPIAATNREQFSKARMGMTEAEVTDLLGSPSRIESYTIKNDLYDIWFYEVMDRGGNTNSVPLTFKNASLVGTNERYYQKVKAKGSVKGSGYDKRFDRMMEEEQEQDFDFW